jgi:hypothetical protein
MYQWVISTLIVAVITVITTILTVKTTTRGYIINPTVKGELTRIAKRYGEIVVHGAALIVVVVALTQFVFYENTPITRFTIFKISGLVSVLSAGLMTLVYQLAHLPRPQLRRSSD